MKSNEIYIINDKIIGTHSKAVFHQNDNTIFDEIEFLKNNVGGGTATTSGRGQAIFKLRGSKIFIKSVQESSSSVTTISYKFPAGDTDRMRRLFVYKPNATMVNIDIPDGVLKLNESLIYNVDTNTLEVRYGTWGNLNLKNNEYLLLYNDYNDFLETGYLGVGGLLSPYLITDEDIDTPIRELNYEICATNGNNLSQGIFICNNNMYHWGHSSDDKTTTLGTFRKYSMSDLNSIVHSGTHNLGHMNAPSYCTLKNKMIVGNGSKGYNDIPLEGYIFNNFKEVLESNPSNIVFNDLDKVVLNFEQFTGEFKCQLCWGDPNTDFCYLLTGDNRCIRKLKLGKGDNNLESGDFVSGKGAEDYNGTYSVISTWTSSLPDIMGGFVFDNGYLYTGVKGDKCIRKITLCNDGTFKSEYLPVINLYGAMQGVCFDEEYLYAFTDGRGYKISRNKL